jgi:hypothetical protein
MVYKMRFVQYFDKKDSEAFLKLEKEFIYLEEKTPDMKKGRRYIPVMGKEPTNTMIWEAEFDSMETAIAALKVIEESSEHDELLDKQIRFMRDTYVEIYKELV